MFILINCNKPSVICMSKEAEVNSCSFGCWTNHCRCWEVNELLCFWFLQLEKNGSFASQLALNFSLLLNILKKMIKKSANAPLVFAMNSAVIPSVPPALANLTTFKALPSPRPKIGYSLSSCFSKATLRVFRDSSMQKNFISLPAVVCL